MHPVSPTPHSFNPSGTSSFCVGSFPWLLTSFPPDLEDCQVGLVEVFMKNTAPRKQVTPRSFRESSELAVLVWVLALSEHTGAVDYYKHHECGSPCSFHVLPAHLEPHPSHPSFHTGKAPNTFGSKPAHLGQTRVTGVHLPCSRLSDLDSFCWKKAQKMGRGRY